MVNYHGLLVGVIVCQTDVTPPMAVIQMNYSTFYPQLWISHQRCEDMNLSISIIVYAHP